MFLSNKNYLQIINRRSGQRFPSPQMMYICTPQMWELMECGYGEDLTGSPQQSFLTSTPTINRCDHPFLGDFAYFTKSLTASDNDRYAVFEILPPFKKIVCNMNIDTLKKGEVKFLVEQDLKYDICTLIFKEENEFYWKIKHPIQYTKLEG